MLLARFLPDPTLPQLSRSLWAFQNTIRGSGYNRFRTLAILYLAAGHFLPRQLRSWISSTMSASPGFGIFLILGFAVAILGVHRFRCYLSRRRASRLGTLAAIASRTIVSDTCSTPRWSRLWSAMMASSSAFNYEDPRSINFTTDKHSCRDDEAAAPPLRFEYVGRRKTRAPWNASAASFEDHLVSEAQSGNEHAFVNWSSDTRDRSNEPYTGLSEPQDTEDIVQETLLSAYRHLSGFRGNSSFYSWVTRIGINNSLMLLRKRKSRQRCRLIRSHPNRRHSSYRKTLTSHQS